MSAGHVVLSVLLEPLLLLVAFPSRFVGVLKAFEKSVAAAEAAVNSPEAASTGSAVASVAPGAASAASLRAASKAVS